MQAYVYKSRRKSDTFVYLRDRGGFGLLPEPLRGSLGELEFVLEVALTPDRKLAREDAAVVRSNLASRGFHLQFPPQPAGAESSGVERLEDMAGLAPTPPPAAPPSPASERGTIASLRDRPFDGDA